MSVVNYAAIKPGDFSPCGIAIGNQLKVLTKRPKLRKDEARADAGVEEDQGAQKNMKRGS